MQKAAPFPPGKTEASPVQADGTIPPQIKAFLQKIPKPGHVASFLLQKIPTDLPVYFPLTKALLPDRRQGSTTVSLLFPGKRGEGTGSETEYADIPVSVLRDFSPRHG